MSTPIRVLLIAPSLDILGGQAVQATRLMKNLGRNPELRMAFQPINPRIGFLRQIPYLRTLCTFVLYNLSVFCRAWHYDILHVFSASYWSYTLWTLPALAAAKLYGKKIILNYRDGQCEDHLTNWRTALPTIRRMDAVITPSGYLVDIFKKFHIPARSFFNIIDPGDFRYRRRDQLAPKFLHNRILEPIYDIQTALQAFKAVQEKYPEATLQVAHDGPSRAELEKFAADIGLKNYKFHGRVPHKQIPELYDSVDIYLTSPVFDCMPGSLLECFASGLPVIATNAGGIPYIAEHNRTALLVDCGDWKAMAGHALRLLEDPALVTRLTGAAFAECQKYAAGPVCQQWAALYRELVSQS